MRGGRKTIPILVASVVLWATALTSLPTSQAAAPTVDALRARRAGLSDQLAHLTPAKNDASRALASAQRSLSAVQDRILGVEGTLKRLNNRLLSLSSQIKDDEETSRQAKRELAGMTRASYKSSSDNAFMDTLLGSSSVGEAVDRLKAEEHTSAKVDDLVRRVNDKDRAVIQERNDLRTNFAQSQVLEDQLSTENNRMIEVVAARDAAYDQASGPVQSVVRQIHDLDQQIAAQAQGPVAAIAGAVGAVAGGPSCGNHFSYGQCTYYVASRRCIPWSGNARDWFANAARMGYNEGHSPAVGAVVAFQPGGEGASGAGHVGYVEAVGPAGGIPEGQFRMSEMNFEGWNRVSYRTLSNNSRGIQGFIYGHP
ncbi:MAG: CHAP domain-containing protein [Candidatus Dormibacteria bacterium]